LLLPFEIGPGPRAPAGQLTFSQARVSSRNAFKSLTLSLQIQAACSLDANVPIRKLGVEKANLTKIMFSRIGIIGDVHAQHHHLELALQHLATQDVDIVLCTGDIVDGEGDVDTCVNLLKSADVQTVRGNHDRWVLQDKARHVRNAHFKSDLSDDVIDYLSALPVQLHLPTTAGQLLLCHGVGHQDLRKVWPGTERMAAERSAELDDLIAQNHLRLMVNGHMHYRTLIHFDTLTLLNAGTVKGDHRPGFSIMDLRDDLVHGYELFADSADPVRHVKTLSLASNDHHQIFKDTSHFDDRWEPVTLYA